MTANSTPKLNHYVPQFLLRRFAEPSSKQLWVFDKREQRSFRTAPRNAAAENHFYRFEVLDQQFSIEGRLAAIEGKAAPVIDRVVATRSLSAVDDTARRILAAFLAAQFVRVKAMRERMQDGRKQLQAWARRIRESYGSRADTSAAAASIPRTSPGELGRGVPLDVLADEELDEASMAREAALFVAKAIPELAPYFWAKDWVLVEPPEGASFVIGDNPITMDCARDTAPYGVGLASRGIEIYLPLCTSLALGLWCESILQDMLTFVVDAEDKRRRGLATAGPDQPRVLLDCFAARRPVRYEGPHLERFNFLQIRHAERYVFGPTDDFSLARRVLQANSAYAIGPRLTMG